MKYYFSTIIFIFVIILTATNVYSCSCMGVLTPQEAINDADTVFKGKAIKINTSFNVFRESYGFPRFVKYRIVLLEINEEYKGNNSKQINIVTGVGGGDCGYLFKEGDEYLVYAYATEEVDKYYTGFCQRTREFRTVDKNEVDILIAYQNE